MTKHLLRTLLLSLFLLSVTPTNAAVPSGPAIVSSIREFDSSRMPVSFAKLWSSLADATRAYRNIKASGDAYGVNWSAITLYDSYTQTGTQNGQTYTAGIIVIKTPSAQRAALCILYVINSGGGIGAMADNWSNDLTIVNSAMKQSLASLISSTL